MMVDGTADDNGFPWLGVSITSGQSGPMIDNGMIYAAYSHVMSCTHTFLEGRKLVFAVLGCNDDDS